MIFKRWRRAAVAPAISSAAAAAAAFQSLRALDASAPFKAELAAAQITPSRIAALYPDSEFAEIAAGLSAKLPQLSPAALSNSLSSCNELADAVMSVIGSELYAALKLGDRPDEAGRAQRQLDIAIADHLAGHLAARGSDSPRLAAHQAVNLVNACWFAWQTMTHREALPAKVQVRVDELMLWVAFTFELS